MAGENDSKNAYIWRVNRADNGDWGDVMLSIVSREHEDVTYSFVRIMEEGRVERPDRIHLTETAMDALAAAWLARKQHDRQERGDDI